MSKKNKLEKYAKETFGVDLDKRLTIKKLETQIKELEESKKAEIHVETSDLIVTDLSSEIIEQITVDKYIAPNGIGNRLVSSDNTELIERLLKYNWKKES